MLQQSIVKRYSTFGKLNGLKGSPTIIKGFNLKIYFPDGFAGPPQHLRWGFL